MKRISRFAGAAALLAVCTVASGCATAAYKPDAFGKGKRFAVVAFVTPPQISYFQNDAMGKTLSGGLKAMGDSGYSADSKRIFDDTRPAILKAFAGTGRFQLIPEQEVLGSKAYAAAPGDDPTKLFLGMGEFRLAPGYKYFKSEKKVADLARALKADSGVIISVHYGYVFSGVSALGLVSAGKIRACVVMTAGAVDGAGRTVWKDFVRETSDQGIPTVGESVDFKTLHPMLHNATEKATRALIKKLQAKV